MDTGVCNANLSALQNSKAPAPMPVSPSTEELFSDVESLQCLDLEAPKSHGQWESLIEKILQHPSQSSPGSWPSELSQENCETHVGFFSGWSASTVCSTNSDDSGEKDLSLCRIKSTQVGKKVCSMSKTRQSRQKRSLPSDGCSGRQSQGKPGAKKSKKPSLVVKSNSEQLPQIEQNLSAARNAAEESNFMGLPSGKGAHIWIERERRKKMSCMFSSLQSLLPNLSPKADKSCVIDEAIAYIQSLEVTLQQLSDQAEVKNRKARTAPLASADQTHHSPQACDQSSPEGVEEMNLSFQTLSSPNAMLIVCGADGFATVSCSSRLSSLELLFSALENENLNVLNAHISTSGSKRFFNIHTKAAKCPDACMGSFEAAFKALSKCLS